MFCVVEASSRNQVFGVDQTPPRRKIAATKLMGAFGEKYPLNKPSEPDSAAVKM